MIINWYSTNIDPGQLSHRLRSAYSLWLLLGSPGKLPTLDQVQSLDLYHDLAPYISITEGQAGADIRNSIFTAAGSKVVELYGMELTARRLGQVLTESGQALVEEVSVVLRNESKPVHLKVAGSEVMGSDIEAIQMPLQHDDAAMYQTMMVYDF